MSTLKYKYAYDEQGKLIHIEDVPAEGHNARTFTCVGCGGAMEAAIGPKRRYFRHKADEASCNKESYLHKLAKLRIKQKFDDKTKPFSIRLCGNIECKDKCRYFSKRDCAIVGPHKAIDLHKYYDTCTIETGHDGYVADLLLTNSMKQNLKPIMIEVFAKHKCTEEKINSKNKIIEVKVTNEDSIDSLVNCVWVQDTWRFDDKENNENIVVSFYGFEPKTLQLSCEECNKLEFGKSVQRFVLIPSGKFFVKDIKCLESKNRVVDNSVFEMNVPYKFGGFLVLEIAHYLKSYQGIEIKVCSVCRNFYQGRDKRYCYANPNASVILSSDDFDALNCPKFELRWLKQLYKNLLEDERLKVQDLEIIFPKK